MSDYTKGSAITSSFFPDDHTHVEPVRYGKGSNLMGLTTNGDDRRPCCEGAPPTMAYQNF
jgi:hypothetical protein